MKQLKKAFSLTELMIAIGVLGIGLTMVASLFVTGLGQVRLSLGASEGMIISANGLEIARTLLEAGDVTATDLSVIADSSCDDSTDPIPAAYQQYPYSSSSTTRGYVVLGRSMSGSTCQLAIVSYNKLGGGNVTAATIIGSVSDTTLTATAETKGNLRIGSPVIISSGTHIGEYATIRSVDDDEAELDHELTMSSTEAYVIHEVDQSDSPATGVLISTVALE